MVDGYAVLFKIPVLIIICCYPYITYKASKQRAVVPRPDIVPAAVEGMSRKHNIGSTDRRTGVTGPTSHVGPDRTRKAGRTPRRRSGFLLLSLMTFTMMVFWTPSIVHYTVISFGAVNWPAVEQVANILCLLETIADPICFTLALKDVRSRSSEEYFAAQLVDMKEQNLKKRIRFASICPTVCCS